jgi:hypothetical protein
MDIGRQVEQIWGHKGPLLFCFVFFCFVFYSFLCSDCVHSCPPFLFRLVKAADNIQTNQIPSNLSLHHQSPFFSNSLFLIRHCPLVNIVVNIQTNQSPSKRTLYISLSPSPSTTTTAISQPLAPAPTTSLLRLTSSINSTIFSNELEYLYTGKGFGEAFKFLFDSSESSFSRDRHLRGDDDHDDADPEALRIDKLRKDLVFMWRSRLYSDVRIALTGNFSSSSPPGDTTTAIFSSHRFILVSRSPYFHNALSWSSSSTKQQPGDVYTGTLIFSHRSYDNHRFRHPLNRFISLPQFPSQQNPSQDSARNASRFIPRLHPV